MPSHHVLGTAALLVGVTGMLGACSASSSHQSVPSTVSPSTAPASTAAPSALSRAAQGMAAARSFRFSADVTRSSGAPVHLVGEFSAPDHLHQIITSGGQPPVEVIFIGGRGYRKRPDGHWVEGTAPGAGAPTDPGAAFHVVAGSPASSSDGTTYHFTLTGAEARRLDGAAGKVEGTATVAGDTITVLSYQGDDPGATKVSIRYSDIGSSPPVVAPKLG